MFKSLKKGFTLIELAIVVAVVGIMASVALTRFSNLNETAEASTARQFLNQLNSGAAIYMARMGQLPTAFTQFVTNNDAQLNAAPAGNNFFTVSVSRVGPRPGGSMCTIAANLINCNGTAATKLGFSRVNAQYTLNAEGNVTATILGQSGATY